MRPQPKKSFSLFLLLLSLKWKCRWIQRSADRDTFSLFLLLHQQSYCSSYHVWGISVVFQSFLIASPTEDYDRWYHEVWECRYFQSFLIASRERFLRFRDFFLFLPMHLSVFSYCFRDTTISVYTLKNHYLLVTFSLFLLLPLLKSTKCHEK